MIKIIADVGSNWQTHDDLLHSVFEAKRAGADAVKFQCYTLPDLYGYWPGNPQIKNCCDIEKELPFLKDYADQAGIEFMCTFFSPDKLLFYKYLLQTIKIASSDLNYPELLKVANYTKKPVILSTAGAYTPEIECALTLLKDCEVTLMYCHGEYPSISHNLDDIYKLEDKFPCHRLGYSDHTIDIYTPKIAARNYPICVLEKHFKLRDMDTPDNGHSLNPRQFKLMVDLINGQDIVSSTKELFRIQHTRRYVSTCDIKEGDTLIYGKNYGAYRTTTPTPQAISALTDITDFVATRPIQAWTALTYDNIRGK